MKGKKEVKRISLSMALLFCAIVALTALTAAWLILNRAVDSEGVQMAIETSPNLVISDSSATIATYSEASWNDNYIVKTWSEAAGELIPADHYDSTTYPAVTGTDNVGLVYNDNPEDVNRNTGKAATNATLTYAHVPADGENMYYIDRTVYIASLEKAMTQGNEYSVIRFTIAETGDGTTTNRAYKSASIDVYVSGTYKGTLNLDTLDTFTISDVASIPLNTSSSIPITFRCYFDGALQDANDASKFYVNSTALSTNTAVITFTVTISAESN